MGDPPTAKPDTADPLPAAVERTVSIVRLEQDEWVATNTDEPSIKHHAESLTDVLAAHRQAIAFRLRKELVLRYFIRDDDTADRIARIRSAGQHIAGLRREASHAEARIRTERVELMRDLADLFVAPGEIAQIVGVPTTAVPKDLGSDREARLARYLATHTDGSPERDLPAPLF